MPEPSASARQSESAALIAKWKDENLCVRCEELLTSPTPCQPANLPSRPTHKSVADLMAQKSPPAHHDGSGQ